MSENITKLKSVLKIWILANYPNNPLGELFQEMILRNPQALYILRNVEKFKNSIKIHFFIHEIAANREGLGTCPSTPRPTCTQVNGSRGSCARLSKFLIGGVLILKAAQMIHNVSFYYWCLNCLSGFDFERGNISRHSDFTRYFYHSLECEWLETSWFEKYDISCHISVLLRKSDSHLQWQGCIHIIQSCIVKTKSVIAIMQNVFCSVKA